MQSTQPVPQPSNTTPVADTAAGAAGVANPYSRSDHAHPLAASYPLFANAGDNGKKLQLGQATLTFSASTTATVTVPFATAFGTTPRVVATWSGGGFLILMRSNTISTAHVTFEAWVSNVAPDGTGGTAQTGSILVDWLAIG